MSVSNLTLDLRHLIRECPECSRRFSQAAVFCPFDGSKLAAPKPQDQKLDPLIGQTLDGRYVIEGVIGEGGMGTVYRARHATLKRPFAVKVLRADLAQEGDLAARFLQEAQATAAIKHPNIVSISDFGRIADGRPYFVMELLNGHTLSSVIKAGRLEPPLAANIAMAVARGLEAAHAAHVVHRDLKPENVFLLDEDAKELRVVDFGAALIMGQSRLTKAGIVFGTPYYMSPEQAAGGVVDHRADVYALGVILYEMLTGRVPFEGDTYMGILTQHMFATPRAPSAAAPELGGSLGALENVVLRALEKEPAKRYATMAELEQAIRNAVELGFGDRTIRALPRVVAMDDSAFPSLHELRERVSEVDARDGGGRGPVIAIGVAFLLLGVGLAFAFYATRSGGARSPVSSSSVSSAQVVTTPIPSNIPPVPTDTRAPPSASTSIATVSSPVSPPPTRTAAQPPKPPKPLASSSPTISTLPPDPFAQ